MTRTLAAAAADCVSSSFTGEEKRTKAKRPSCSHVEQLITHFAGEKAGSGVSVGNPRPRDCVVMSQARRSRRSCDRRLESLVRFLAARLRVSITGDVTLAGHFSPGSSGGGGTTLCSATGEGACLEQLMRIWVVVVEEAAALKFQVLYFTTTLDLRVIISAAAVSPSADHNGFAARFLRRKLHITV